MTGRQPVAQKPQVIRPNQVIGWTAAVVAVVAATAGSTAVDLPWGGPLLWQVFCGAMMLLLLDALWRHDFRPRLLWNAGGLVLVDRDGAHRYAWSDVRTVSARGNTISIRTPEGLLQTHFDRPWWLARLRPSIRDLPETIQARLRTAHEAAVAGSAEEPPPAPRVRRPVALYLLAAAGLLAIVGTTILT
ncbi:hypothetical protein [Phytohabitans kaempferiae]|uniref:PH domain-containing protein n=1 Tax=Phytohabitans kaempferiae TaxID=1620943 RepID=A0ABV6MCH6_9ACTN